MNALTPNDIAGRLNLKSGRGGRWRGDCPACGYAGTFVLTARDGEADLWCASCRDSAAIRASVQDIAGGKPLVLSRREAKPKNDAERIAKALRCWEGAIPAGRSPARLYLANRGLAHLADSPVLRWSSENTHPERGAEACFDAMIALVHDALGHPVAVHRTYINRRGGKSNLDPCKASLGILGDGAIRLADAGRELVIGEGIETAASLGLLMGLPAWAAVSAGQMCKIGLPVQVRHVVIAVDVDPPAKGFPEGPGRYWAQRAAQRWDQQGRKVSLATPDKPGQDFNDILMERIASGGAHAG